MTANSNKVGAHGENGATFEESFTRLQEVVGKLSAGNLSLQEALGAFEEGMGLAERCAKMLDEAELRVKQVSDRAVQAGSTSLAGLDEEMRGVPSRIGTGEEQLVVEIESYEATFVQVEQPQAEERNSRTAQVAGQQAKAKSAPQGAQARTLESELELDPLFDDED